jgi:hypothetical protein
MAQNKLVNDLEYIPFSAHIEPFAPTLSPLIAESLAPFKFQLTVSTKPLAVV